MHSTNTWWIVQPWRWQIHTLCAILCNMLVIHSISCKATMNNLCELVQLDHVKDVFCSDLLHRKVFNKSFLLLGCLSNLCLLGHNVKRNWWVVYKKVIKFACFLTHLQTKLVAIVLNTSEKCSVNFSKHLAGETVEMVKPAAGILRWNLKVKKNLLFCSEFI